MKSLLTALTVLVLAAGPVEAAVWQVDLDLRAGATVVRDTIVVDLAEPVGSATALVAGVPLVVSRTASQLSLVVDTSVGIAGCTITVAASGGAFLFLDVSIGSMGGTLTQSCPGAPAAVSPISGTYVARGGIFLGPLARVEAVNGVADVTQLTLGTRSLVVGAILPSPAKIRTGSGAEALIRLPDNSALTIRSDTTVTYFALAFPGPSDLAITLLQATGTLEHAVTPGPFPGLRGYAVVAPTGSISVTGTDFTTRYSQVGTLGSLSVAVEQGIVEVSGREAVIGSVTAGAQRVVEAVVPRVTVLLPVGTVTMGKTNTLSWTVFPGAAGYLVEFTAGPAGFARANAPIVEFPGNVIRVPAAALAEIGGSVDFALPVPAAFLPPGSRASLRVFATDGAGQVLAGTTASDTVQVALQ